MNGKVISLVLVGTALATAALSGAPAHAADRVIASSGAFVTPVEAHGGNVVWGEVAVGGMPYVYFVRDARGTRRLPLGRMRVRDIDLGAARGGRTRAVFVRCPLEAVPKPDCVIRDLDLRTGATRAVSSLVRVPGSEGSPAVWNDRFAFTRNRAGNLGLFASNPLRRVTGAKVVSTDLRGSRLAYVTQAPGGPPDPWHGDSPQTNTVRVATLPRGRGGPRSCFIARATGGPSVVLSDVELTDTHVLWLRRDLRDPAPTPGTINRVRLPARGCPAGGTEERSRQIPRLRSFALDRGRVFYTTNNNVWEATDPLAFTR